MGLCFCKLHDRVTEQVGACRECRRRGKVIRRIHLILLFVESCLSRLITVPIVPVRKAILIIWFALCGALWLLLVLSAYLMSLWVVARGPRFVIISGPNIGLLRNFARRCGRFTLFVAGVPTGCWTGYMTFLSIISRMVSALHRPMF